MMDGPIDSEEDECDVCGGEHDTDRCPELVESTDTNSSLITTRARATLPTFMRLVEDSIGPFGVDVLAVEDIPSRFKLGQVEAPRSTICPGNVFPLQIMVKDSTKSIWLDMGDEDKCNWMCLIPMATNAAEKNMMALQIGMEIVFMTTREIKTNEVLRVGYAPSYARKIRQSSIPVENIVEPIKPIEQLDYSDLSLPVVSEEDVTKLQDIHGTPITITPIVSAKRKSARTTKKTDASPSIGVFLCAFSECGLVFPCVEALEQHQAKHTTLAEEAHESSPDVSFDQNDQVKNEPHDQSAVTLSLITEELSAVTDLHPDTAQSLARLITPRSTLIQHRGPEPQTCDYCGKIFTDMQKMAEHIKQHLVDSVKQEVTSPRKSSRARTRSKRIDPDFIYPENRNKKRKTAGETPGMRVEILEEILPTQSAAVDWKSKNQSQKKLPKIVVVEANGEGTPDKSFSVITESNNTIDLLNEDAEHNNDTQYTVIEIIDADTAEVQRVKLETETSGMSAIMNETGNFQQWSHFIPLNDSISEINKSPQQVKSESGIMEAASEATSKSTKSYVNDAVLTETLEVIQANGKGSELEKAVPKKQIQQDVVVINDQENVKLISKTPVIIDDEQSCEEIEQEVATKDATISNSNQNISDFNSGEDSDIELDGSLKDDELEVTPDEIINDKSTEKSYCVCKICGRWFDKIQHLKYHMIRHKGSLDCKSCKTRFYSKKKLMEHKCADDTNGAIQNHVCKFCGADFKKKAYLIAHMAIHTKEHSCEGCKESFARRETLMKHWTKCMPEKVASGELKVFACKLCPRVFSRNITLGNHIKAHDQSFTCDVCHQSFASKFSMNRHKCVADDKGVQDSYTCDECGKSFTKKWYLTRHMAFHVGTYFCVLCKQIYGRKVELMKHILECSAALQAESSGEIFCTVCEKKFPDAYSFRTHYEIHTHPYQCDGCDKGFLRPFALNEHKKKCTRLQDTNSVACSICEKRFASEDLLRRHKPVHDDPRYSCNTCGKKFRKINFLNNHVCVDNEGKIVRVQLQHVKSEFISSDPVVCPTCGKSFSTMSNLNKHMLLHGEKKETCSECGKKFHLKAALREHMKYVHTDQYQVSCKVCGKRMKSRNSLYGHMQLYHTSTESLFPCEECGKTFRQKGNLKKHMIIHSDKKTYACSYCIKTFKFPEQHRRHELWHTTGPRFYCDFCDKGFMMEFELRRHLKTTHEGLTYVCCYCNLDCHYAHSMRRHLQRRHYDMIEWQSTPNEFIRTLATQTMTVTTSSTKPGEPARQVQLQIKAQPGAKTEKQMHCCGKFYSSLQEYKVHIDETHRKLQYNCCYCEETFQTTQLMLEHLMAQHDHIDDWKTNSEQFIENLSTTEPNVLLKQIASIKTESEDITSVLSIPNIMSESILARTLTEPLDSVADLTHSHLLDSQEPNYQVVELPDTNFDRSPRPVIVAEIQGLPGDGNNSTQTVIIQGDGTAITSDGVISPEIAEALKSLTAQGLLSGTQSAMITIGMGDGVKQTVPVSVGSGEEQGLVMLPVTDQESQNEQHNIMHQL